MRIAIVYPPYYHADNQPNIKEVSKNYGIFPNLSLAHVAGIMEQAGHDVIFIDANALGLPKEEVLLQVKQFAPDMLAFTLSTYIIHQNLSWIKYLKKETGLPTLVGGVHVSLYPNETFTHKEIDYATLGEAEFVLPKFLTAFENGSDFSKLEGVVYRKGNKIIVNQNMIVTKDLDSVPFPARHLLPNEKYFEFISKRKNFTGVVTSRGCPYQCIYCEQGAMKHRFRSAKNVADEFEECYTKYGIREIDVFDSSFTVNKKRVIETAREIASRKLDIHWAIRSRVDTIDEEMLRELAKAGCKRIYYGIESGVPRILKTLKKGTNLRQIKKTIELTNKYGIMSFGYFMIGSPGETSETIKKTIAFAKRLPLDYAQFSKVSPLPGTELYDMVLKEIKFDYWAEYVKNENTSMQLPRPNVTLSEDEIQVYVKKAYNAFYMRPSYVFRSLKRLQSFEELVRSAKAAIHMMLAR